MKKIVVFFIGILIIQGCALEVGLLDPSPDLELTKTNQSICLSIDKEVQNSFFIPEYSGIKKSKIKDWHTSLKNGFNNGFEKYYKVNKTNSESDLVLKLSKTDVSFIPTSISGYNNTTVLKVNIEFKAQLLDKDGKEIKNIADTAISKKTINKKGQENEVVEDAIEIMYKMIANTLFN